MSIPELFDVCDKVAVLTGGASGIGLACAEAIAENGGIVVLLDMNESALQREVARLRGLGYRADGAKLDVTDRVALAATFQQIFDKYGRLDICFANAGIDPGSAFSSPDGTRNPAGEIDNLADELWDRSIAVMLTGVFNTVKAAARHMKPGNRGSIIVTTSVAAHFCGGKVGTPYMPAKAGAAHFVRQVALDLARYNIRVNSIAPGGFITNIGGGHVHDPAVQKMFAQIIPLGRMAKADEIKGLALFLASDASAFVTGAEVIIDGGMLIGPAE